MASNTDTMATNSIATQTMATILTTETMTTVINRSSLLQTPAPNEEGGNTRVYNLILSVIYSVVLVIGTISLSLMMHIMKSGSISTTSIAVLNLIFAHFIFLVTVPFRIYYYANNNWQLGLPWCKVVSSMIHIHMYMSFIFYTVILITRQLTFYRKTNILATPSRIHAYTVSGLLWLLAFIVTTCILLLRYGKYREGHGGQETPKNETKQCFNFGKHIETAKEVNYFLSTVIIVVTFTLTVLQANVLRVLYRKHHDGCTSQQEFGAQFKSFCFALIMFACFIPYHIFRLYYLEHLKLQDLNEVFLSLTTFNCLDTLTFLGRRTCSICNLGKSI